MTAARALRLLIVLLAVTVMAGAMTWAAGPEGLRLNAAQSAGVAFAWASLLGVPVVMWTLDQERPSLSVYLPLSLGAGALLPVLALSSGILGQFMHGGADYLGFALRHGAPLPWYGLIAWPAFVHMTWQAALVGAMGGSVGWLVVVGPRRSPAAIALLSAAIVAMATGLAALTHVAH